jgi:hypothetical protein
MYADHRICVFGIKVGYRLFLGQVFLTKFVFVGDINCFLGGVYVQLAAVASVGFL